MSNLYRKKDPEPEGKSVHSFASSRLRECRALGSGEDGAEEERVKTEEDEEGSLKKSNRPSLGRCRAQSFNDDSDDDDADFLKLLAALSATDDSVTNVLIFAMYSRYTASRLLPPAPPSSLFVILNSMFCGMLSSCV